MVGTAVPYEEKHAKTARSAAVEEIGKEQRDEQSDGRQGRFFFCQQIDDIYIWKRRGVRSEGSTTGTKRKNLQVRVNFRKVGTN